ncbi:MAG: glycosyltransferase family 4 protein [Bacteroidota bacterium]
MPKVLFITNHRKDRSPGQRFRFEQHLDFLEKNGYEITFSYFLNERDDRLFYSSGNYFHKVRILIKNIWMRAMEVITANQYDIIFIFREATVLGTSLFEKWMAKSKAKLIFDFDDSIWIDNVSEGNKNLSFLKNAKKTSDIITVCDLIFAGNQYLADYAKQFNKNVRIIPTTIDTQEYQRIPISKQDNKVCIGWSGSFSTIQHFKYALPALTEIKKKYGDKISVKVIGDAKYKNEELGVISLNWNKEDELKELSSFDIGIMPLPDDEWAKGKCGLKGLQYMALEIPTIMSPVGVNSEIIQDGTNGFLAFDKEEWIDKLSQLIESDEKRKAMGLAARKTVVEKYSVASLKERYLSLFNQLIK